MVWDHFQNKKIISQVPDDQFIPSKAIAVKVESYLD